MPRCWLFAYHEKKCNIIAAPPPSPSPSPALFSRRISSSGSHSNSSSRSPASSRCSPSSPAQSTFSGFSGRSGSFVNGGDKGDSNNRHSNTQIMANMLLSIMDAEDSSADLPMRNVDTTTAHPSTSTSTSTSPAWHHPHSQCTDPPTPFWGRQSSSSSTSKLDGPRESAWHEPPGERACEEVFMDSSGTLGRGRHSSASKQNNSGRHYYSPVLRGRASVDGFFPTRSPGPARQFGNLMDLSRIDVSKLRI